MQMKTGKSRVNKAMLFILHFDFCILHFDLLKD